MWFTLFYTPNRYSTTPLVMKGRFYSNFSSAALSLALLRSHVQSAIEGWYMRDDATGKWIDANFSS